MAIVGGTVCVYHGGRAPQVRAAAQARLEEALPTALEQLVALLTSADQDSVRLRAMEAVLDRTLGKVTDKLKLSGDIEAPLEIIISRGSSPTTDNPALGSGD